MQGGELVACKIEKARYVCWIGHAVDDGVCMLALIVDAMRQPDVGL
jgi:hypothetical protein